MHLLRNSFRYASKRDWPALARDLEPIYTAPTEAAALERLADLSERWEDASCATSGDNETGPGS